MTVCEEIGKGIAAAQEPLSDPVTHAATRALVDWVAAVMAGSDHASTQVLRAVAETVAGDGPCSIIGSSRKTDPRTAALINATASHATEVDDIYRDGIYHPGTPTIAAALAIAQLRKINGAEFLRAIAIGYEVGCRVAASINPAHYEYWHTTGTVGTIGAAAAASAALGLDSERSAHAIAIATTVAAGLQQSFRSEAMSKPLHSGHASDSGVLAALAAEQGFTGALDVLEGPAGFGAAMSKDVDWSRVTKQWTEPWAIQEMTVKNHTACGHTFAAIDAMLSLRDEGLRAEDVQHVAVETAQIPINVAGNLNPQTEFEAKFSIPYCVASALVIGSVRFDAFGNSAMSDPKIRELVAKTELVAVDEFTSVFPGQRAARVIVTKTDGEILKAEAWTRRGDPDSPLTDDELSGKFTELANPALKDATESVLRSLWNINNAASVATLIDSD